MLIVLFLARLRASSRDVSRMEPGAAPAGGARNAALGRSRDPTGGHSTPLRGARWTGPSRASVGPKRVQVLSLRAKDPPNEETWTWKRGPGIRNRRDGAPRGARAL